MEKWMCRGGLIVSGLLFLLFLLDIVLYVADMQPLAPFGGMDIYFDVIGMLISALLFYLSWNAIRETR